MEDGQFLFPAESSGLQSCFMSVLNLSLYGRLDLLVISREYASIIPPHFLLEIFPGAHVGNQVGAPLLEP